MTVLLACLLAAPLASLPYQLGQPRFSSDTVKALTAEVEAAAPELDRLGREHHENATDASAAALDAAARGLMNRCLAKLSEDERKEWLGKMHANMKLGKQWDAAGMTAEQRLKVLPDYVFYRERAAALARLATPVEKELAGVSELAYRLAGPDRRAEVDALTARVSAYRREYDRLDGALDTALRAVLTDRQQVKLDAAFARSLLPAKHKTVKLTDDQLAGLRDTLETLVPEARSLATGIQQANARDTARSQQRSSHERLYGRPLDKLDTVDGIVRAVERRQREADFARAESKLIRRSVPSMTARLKEINAELDAAVAAARLK